MNPARVSSAAEAGRTETESPAARIVSIEVAATASTELHASSSSFVQRFHGNCASLGTHLSSLAIVFVSKYVEVFPCRVEKYQQEPHCPPFSRSITEFVHAQRKSQIPSIGHITLPTSVL